MTIYYYMYLHPFERYDRGLALLCAWVIHTDSYRVVIITGPKYVVCVGCTQVITAQSYSHEGFSGYFHFKSTLKSRLSIVLSSIEHHLPGFFFFLLTYWNYLLLESAT